MSAWNNIVPLYVNGAFRWISPYILIRMDACHSQIILLMMTCHLLLKQWREKAALNSSLKYRIQHRLIMNKIAIFVDVQNIYYTTRETYGRQFNYHKLWQRIGCFGEIVSATAYAIDRGDSRQEKFQAALKHIGFDIKLKPFIQRSDGSAKGDWDVGITIDVMEAAREIDTVVLLSGDGDFDLLLRKIRQDFDVDAIVYGVPGLTANSLINEATTFYPIDQDLLL